MKLRKGQRVIVLHGDEREPGVVLGRMSLSIKGNQMWSIKLDGKSGTYAISEPCIEVPAPH